MNIVLLCVFLRGFDGNASIQIHTPTVVLLAPEHVQNECVFPLTTRSVFSAFVAVCECTTRVCLSGELAEITRGTISLTIWCQVAPSSLTLSPCGHITIPALTSIQRGFHFEDFLISPLTWEWTHIILLIEIERVISWSSHTFQYLKNKWFDPLHGDVLRPHLRQFSRHILFITKFKTKFWGINNSCPKTSNATQETITQQIRFVSVTPSVIQILTYLAYWERNSLTNIILLNPHWWRAHAPRLLCVIINHYVQSWVEADVWRCINIHQGFAHV